MDNFSTIKVTLNEVMDCLKLVSSYLGGKRETDSTAYDNVAALDSDSPLVAMLMEDAALLLAARFPGPLLRWRYYRSALEFTLEGEFDADALHPALAKTVALTVLRRWLRISGSAYADEVSASAEELADALKIYFPEKTEEAPQHVAKASPRCLPPL